MRSTKKGKGQWLLVTMTKTSKPMFSDFCVSVCGWGEG